jgi:hypothetical protein
VLPALAGAGAVLLALPIFLLAEWRLSGWALGAALYAASQGISLLLARLRVGADNLAAAGAVAFVKMLRAIVIMVVVLIVAVSDPRLALAAALVYALAYSLELGTAILGYLLGPVTR